MPVLDPNDNWLPPVSPPPPPPVAPTPSAPSGSSSGYLDRTTTAQTPPRDPSITVFAEPPIDYRNLALNDPFYKQNLEWLHDDTALAQQRLNEDRGFAERLYQLDRAQAQASASAARAAANAGAAEEAALDALRKEQAAHDYELSKETLREVMASRGMIDSGQYPFEKAEAQYDYTSFLKELDLQAAARAAQRAASAASAQAGLSSRMQEMELRHQISMMGFDRDLADLTRGASRSEGDLLMDTMRRLADTAPTRAAINAVYDPSRDAYYDQASNTWYDPQKNKLPGDPGVTGGGSNLSSYNPWTDPPPPPTYVDNPDGSITRTVPFMTSTYTPGTLVKIGGVQYMIQDDGSYVPV